MSMTQTNQLGMEPGGELGAIDILGALRRRKWIGVLVVFVGFGLTVAAALLWPPTYRSIATILIEEPDVPDDLVKSTVSVFAEERLQLIQQRVMTTQNLNDIIDRFGLYADDLATRPRSEVVDAMRDKIDLEVVSTDLIPQKNSSLQPPKASIAFTISFDHDDARLAQQVASRLTDLYLAENAQSRQEKAAGTTEFLTQQSQQLYADMQNLEAKLTDFKGKHAGSLPEQLNLNMQILDQVQTALLQNRRDSESLAEKRAALQSQLAQLSPYQPMTSQGQPATPQAQLMALELSYVDLSAKYGPKHPDVIHLQKQIETLKGQLGTSTDQVSSQAELSQLQQQLADALQRYGEQHPQVQKLRKQIAGLKGELGKPAAASMISAPKGPPDNPIYIQLQSELGDTTAQMEGVQSQTAALQAKVTDLQARVLETPALESEYNSLLAQYDAAVKRYQDFKDKQADAQVAQNMEQQSKGETFSVIDAPQLPDTPVKPNRKLLLLVGGVLSALLGLTAMFLLEMTDKRIYEARGLQMVFGDVPLATVPYISTRQERIGRRLRATTILLVVLGVVGGALAVVHTTFMPLDVLMAAFINRINF
jgi:succinoglycan biosynthesis transport protein ExoP